MKSLAVLGVDPGIVNTGICLMKRVSGENAFRGFSPAIRANTVYQTLDRLGDSLNSFHHTHGWPDIVVVERQYGHKQGCVAHFIQGYYLGKGIETRFHHPNTLESRRNRIINYHQLDVGIIPSRIKLKRSAGKWLNMRTMDILFPLKISKGIKRDDIADAFIYSYDTLLDEIGLHHDV